MKKLVLDEKVRHRLTGVLVIISIAVIFLPAMIKRSNQHLNERVNVSVKLPPKPVFPKVAMVQEKSVFSEVKVAQVDMPTLASAPPPSKTVQVAFQEEKPLAPVVEKLPEKNMNFAKNGISEKLAVASAVDTSAKSAISTKLASNLKVALPSAKQKLALKKENYVVQLAAFGQEKNAVALVSKLKAKGYVAKYSKQAGMYKVFVNSIGGRDSARLLQKQLSDTMQITGLIIKA